MSIGVYGNIRPADINPDDLDMFYTYVPNRETLPTAFTRLDASTLITEFTLPSDDQVSGEENLLTGMYNVSLPSTTFNQVGIYTIYIRPKVIRATIVDCGVLSSLPSIKGIVININDLDTNLRTNNALQGYRIEYIESDGTKLRNVVRYVTTSNRAVPVIDNIGNTTQTAVRYRFDDNGNLLFVQLTPSSASSVKPNLTPFIGKPNQKILISNTFVNPEIIEIEMVENTIDTVINYVAGEQIRDVNKGIITYYDKDRNIIKQVNVYDINNTITGNIDYEVRENRTTVDTSQDFDTITGDVQGA